MSVFDFLKFIAKINPRKWALWEWGLILASFGLGMGLSKYVDFRIEYPACVVFILGTLLLFLAAVLDAKDNSQAVGK